MIRAAAPPSTYDVEIVVDAPADTLAPRLPRALGLLEPVDEGTARLVGSTSNPAWYAEQLAAIPAPFRVVRCPELQEAARVLGRRMLAAGTDARRPQPGDGRGPADRTARRSPP